MKPILYPANATAFNNRGLGALADAVSCVVVEERNGEYELELEYPVNGVGYENIGDRCIITAIPSPYRAPQPFRIYQIEKPLNGIVTIRARHLSYDLSGIPVSPFTADSCATALNGLLSHSVVTNPFTVWTDKSVDSDYKLSVPTSFRACLGGQEGSILDVYGKGEYEFDKYAVKLHLNRGSDNGVKIAYGKNLIDFNMERNLETIVTGILPYWANIDEDNVVEGDIITIYDINNPAYLLESGGAYLLDSDGKYLLVQNPFPFNNVLPLDLSSEFESAPTKAELKERTEKYIRDNGLGVPKVSVDVSFVQLEQTEEYKDIAVLEACDLCDTVTVEFPLYGISAKAEIIRIETDVLLEKYNAVQIGDARTSLADTLAHLEVNSVTKSEAKAGNQKAADVIENTKGTIEYISNGDGTNSGIIVHEEGSELSWLKMTAGGIGLSEDGGLTYTNAITKNGVTATQIDIKENDLPIFYAGYDEENDGISISAYYPSFNTKEFEITSGKWAYQGSPQEGSWLARVVLRDPEQDEDRITLESFKVLLQDDQDYSYMSQFFVVSGVDDEGKTSRIRGYAGMSYLNHAKNSYASLGVSADGAGSIFLYANTLGYPSLQVNDPSLASPVHMLKLMPITINGTQYYMFASTN